MKKRLEDITKKYEHIGSKKGPTHYHANQVCFDLGFSPCKYDIRSAIEDYGRDTIENILRDIFEFRKSIQEENSIKEHYYFNYGGDETDKGMLPLAKIAQGGGFEELSKKMIEHTIIYLPNSPYKLYNLGFGMDERGVDYPGFSEWKIEKNYFLSENDPRHEYWQGGYPWLLETFNLNKQTMQELIKERKAKDREICERLFNIWLGNSEAKDYKIPFANPFIELIVAQKDRLNFHSGISEKHNMSSLLLNLAKDANVRRMQEIISSNSFDEKANEEFNRIFSNFYLL